MFTVHLLKLRIDLIKLQSFESVIGLTPDSIFFVFLFF